MLRSLLLAATCLTTGLAALPAASQGLAGPYLSARVAGFNNDYAAAGQSYRDLIEQGETTPQILENALIIYSVLGDFDAAVDVADILAAQDQNSQFAASARMVVALRDGVERAHDRMRRDHALLAERLRRAEARAAPRMRRSL